MLIIDTVLVIEDIECESVTFSSEDDKALLNSLTDTYSDLYTLIMRNRKLYDKFREELLKYGLFMNFWRVFFIEPLINELNIEGKHCEDMVGIAALKVTYAKMRSECEPKRFEGYHTYLGYESIEGSMYFHANNCRFLNESNKKHKYFLVKKEAKRLGLIECDCCIQKKKKCNPEEFENHERQQQEFKQKRTEFIKLLEDYNRCCLEGRGANYLINRGGVSLTISKTEFSEISIERACAIIKDAIIKIPDSNKGRGYLSNNMSVNAKVAHSKGRKPKSYFTREKLDELGFKYSVVFFNWLIERKYLLPAEMHHTSAAKRNTAFYSTDSISNLIKYYDLDLLYKLYSKEITFEEAELLRGIKYAIVELPLVLLTGNRGENIDVKCILYDDYIFISQKLYFLCSDKRLKIKHMYECRPSIDFFDERLEKTVKYLVISRPRVFYKYLRIDKH